MRQVTYDAKPRRIVFVADPSRYSTLKDAMEWEANYWERKYTADFTRDDYLWLQQEFPKSIFESGDGCLMQEFVSITVNAPILILIFSLYAQLIIPLTLRHDSRRFVVKLLHWEKFMEAMLSKKEEANHWNVLTSSDFVIGGIDMTIPYL